MKLLYLTNIPAPYRTVRFNTMHELFTKFDIEFEVLFMGEIEPDRTWIINWNEMKYNYKIFNNILPRNLFPYSYFNPSLLKRLKKNDYDILIIGGIHCPTLILAPYFANKKAVKIISVESNLLSSTVKKGKLISFIKKIILNQADAYQVTGELQKEYIQYYSPSARNKPYIKLRNLIDGRFYAESVIKYRDSESQTLRKSLSIKDNEQMWIMPIRLIPIKAPEIFIKALKGTKGVKLIICGEGEMLSMLNQYIDENNISAKIVPFQQQSELVKYYAAADVFCLNSISDASPLTPIEACACSLPLILSNRIGNLNDVLIENVNGISSIPDDIENLRKVIDWMASKSKNELKIMGKESYKIFINNFELKNSINNYAKDLSILNDLFNKK